MKIFNFLLLILVSTGCASSSDINRETVTEKQPAPIKVNALEPAPQRKGQVVAVLPFRTKSDDGLGELYATLLGMELSDLPNVQVVERGRINEIIAEIKLGRSELASSDAAVRAGRLLGANLMVFGATTEDARNKFVSARSVNVETSEIIGAAFTQEKDAPVVANILARAIIPSITRHSKSRTTPTAAPKKSIDDPPASSTVSDPDSFAIIIGVERYRAKEIPQAAFARNDAETVYRYLTEAMGFPRANVVRLLDEEAGRSDFEKYFKVWLPNRITAKSHIFVYFSGHGAPEPATNAAYIVPFDGDPKYFPQTALGLNDIYTALAALPAKRITIMLDSCFSGLGDRSIMNSALRPLVQTQIKHANLKNFVIMTASSARQVSASSTEHRHGLFTYSMLNGLHGAAAVDGLVTTDSLFRYIAETVEVAAWNQNVEQRPSVYPGLRHLGQRGQDVWLSLKKNKTKAR